MNGADRARMEQMQKEAVRRAREMQQRAAPSAEIPPMPNFVKTPYATPAKPPAPPKPPTSSTPPKPPAPPRGMQLLRMLNFGGLRLQGDTLLVVMLLLLLAADDADELLLLALVYILL